MRNRVSRRGLLLGTAALALLAGTAGATIPLTGVDSGNSAGATTWSPTDKSATLTLTNSNLTASTNASSNTTNDAVRGTVSHTDKRYYKLTVVTGSATNRLGIANATFGLSNFLGNDANGLGVATNGSAFLNNVSLGSIGAYTTGSVVEFCIDFTNKLFWGRVNAGSWNTNVSANPGTGVGGYSMAALAAGPWFPCVNIGSFEAASFTAAFNATTPVPSFPNWDT